MSDATVLKILFVINPRAGAKSNTNWEQEIRDYFDHHPHAATYFIVDEHNDSNALKKVIDELKPHRVIAVGGDGTVTMVAHQVKGTDMIMGILPAGSANGMAKELNIPLTPKDALDIAANGRTGACDLILINDGEICLHLSDIGLNAQLIKYFDEGKVRGKLGYARVLLKTLWNKQRMNVLIETEKEQVKLQAFMVVLANASKYGTGAVINPEGKIDDGLFEVVVVKKIALSEIFKMLFKPQPFNPRKIESFPASSTTIETRRKMHFQIDGEYKGQVKQVKARVLFRSVQLLLPPEDPR